MNSVLCKGLNFAVFPLVLPIKDILGGVEKNICTLPEEASAEIKLETVRIFRQSKKL
jgi:hypothetical protein